MHFFHKEWATYISTSVVTSNPLSSGRKISLVELLLIAVYHSFNGLPLLLYVSICSTILATGQLLLAADLS